MYKKILISVAFLLFIITNISAQNSTSSPYSRYGIGDLTFSGLAVNASMGKTAIGKQNPYNINPLNPASYSSFVANSFIFDVGYLHKLNQTKTSESSWISNNSNLQYMVAGFAVKKWWGTSFGVLPISTIGYEFKTEDSLFVSDGYSKIYQLYEGEGGLNKFYWGNSFEATKNLSIGINLNYNFGSIDRNSYSEVKDAKYSNFTDAKHRYLVKGFNYNLGLQYCDSLKSKKDTTISKLVFTAGLVFDNSSKLNTLNTLMIYQEQSINNNASSDTIINDTLTGEKLMLPRNYGAGFSVKFNQKLTFSADYYIQNWSAITIFDENYKLLNSSSLGIGFDYCIKEYSKSHYYETIHYRVGGFYENSSINVKDQQIKKYGVTFGAGFPIKSSIINVGFELGTRGTTDFNLAKENYVLLNLDFSLYELWFVKSKFY